MCVFFIALLIISSRFNSLPRTCLPARQVYFGVKSQKPNVNRQGRVSPKAESQNPESGIPNPASSIKQFPSPIFPLPFLLFLLPGLWFLLTSLWSSFPEVSAARALYFVLISAGSISAGFLWLRYSVKGLFDFLLPANIFIVLLCVFSLITNIPSDSWTGGHGKGFMGFFGHQNLLASVLLFTLPAVLGLKIKEKSKRINVEVFFFILLSLNLIVLALTYSRTSILAFIFGVIVFLILNKKWKVILYGIGAAAVLSMIIYFTPTLNDPVDKILKKDFPEIYSSRMWMWEPSYKAALEGGLIGLGYGISHPEIRSGEYSDRFENGRLDKRKRKQHARFNRGSRIGRCAIIYFTNDLFIIPISRCQMPDADKIMYPETVNPNPVSASSISLLTTTYSLLTAALAAFILHAQFEAWWVGVGSVQLPLFFIYIGLLIEYQQIKSQ